jgi:hypothetical protein
LAKVAELAKFLAQRLFRSEKLHPKKAKNFEKKILGFKAETNSY